MTDAPTVAVDIRNLYHSYKRQDALSGVSFEVHARSIHGFVGPNGAGKTTTLKLLATLLKPQRGEIRVFGHDIRTQYCDVRRRIGFMPDHFSMYRQMTVQEYIDFFAAAYGFDYAQRTRTIADVLALTDMESRRNDLISGLSRGMQQRVSLARVLVNDPDLLLLDEPASGLDPRARIELMEILKELRRMGKTIFISSHILSELALLCDSVSILDRGQVKYSGSMAGLVQRDGPLSEYMLGLEAETPEVEAAMGRHPGVTQAVKLDSGGRYRVSFQRERTDLNALLRVVMENGGRIVEFREDTRHLNQAFMDLTSPGIPPPLPTTGHAERGAVVEAEL